MSGRKAERERREISLVLRFGRESKSKLGWEPQSRIREP